jgi:hypothetical protein
VVVVGLLSTLLFRQFFFSEAFSSSFVVGGSAFSTVGVHRGHSEPLRSWFLWSQMVVVVILSVFNKWVPFVIC